jgi:hypothetical protein
MTDLTVLLSEAETAYHRLMTGSSMVELRDSNGESVRYSAISANKLLGYILSLKRQLGVPTGLGPMRVRF